MTQWAPYGDFRAEMLVSLAQPDPHALVGDDGFLGLPLAEIVPYGTFRDDEGELYSIVRRQWPGAQDNTGKIIVFSTRGDNKNLTIDRAGKYAVGNASITRQLVGASLEMTSAATAEGKASQLRWTGSEISWTEEDLLEISGPLIGSGTQWYLPRPHDRMIYCSQFYFGEGTLLGRPIRGFIGFDQVYLPRGRRLYTDDPWVGEKSSEGLELAWYTWGTRYTDGSWEVGQFAAGHGRSGVAFISTSNGAEVATTDISVTVEPESDGYWVLHVHFTVEGEAWRFDPDPRGRMTSFGDLPNPQQEGWMHRPGEDRQPEVWWCWGETYPAHGIRRRPHLEAFK
jgi:hypothetical protein